MEHTKVKGKSLMEFRDSYVVVDIETTGLNPREDQIIEIGAIKVDEDGVVTTFETLIKPDFPISEFITHLTGITNGMLDDDGKEIEESLRLFDEFVGEYTLIGHNVNFDLGFLNDKYYRYLDKRITNDFIDTLRLARRYVPRLPNHKLATVASYFSIDTSGHHRALADVQMTLEVYVNIANRYQ